MAQATTAHLKKATNIPILITAVLGTMLLGFLSGLLSGSMHGYGDYVVPPLTPPDIVFPIVWGVLYFMIGLSLFFIIRRSAVTAQLVADRKVATVLWIVQFVFNIAWPFAFFALELYTFSMIWLAALVAINLALIIYAFKVSKVSGALLIPYEVWLTFALYLNMFIALMN